jgi:hypothetical protein
MSMRLSGSPRRVSSRALLVLLLVELREKRRS